MEFNFIYKLSFSNLQSCTSLSIHFLNKLFPYRIKCKQNPHHYCFFSFLFKIHIYSSCCWVHVKRMFALLTFLSEHPWCILTFWNRKWDQRIELYKMDSAVQYSIYFTTVVLSQLIKQTCSIKTLGIKTSELRQVSFSYSLLAACFPL